MGHRKPLAYSPSTKPIHMKPYLIVLLLLLASLTPRLLHAQESLPFSTQPIPYARLQISEQMTTNLIFPHAIKSVDRGNRGILVQKAQEAENILQVKAESETLANSNLTVLTEKGGFYSFSVEYQATPEAINLKILPTIFNSNSDLKRFKPSETEITQTAEEVSRKNRSNPTKRQRRFLTGLRLMGIYIEQDLLFFQFQLENQTNIPYDIEQFRLFIRDNKPSKRTASQELEQTPVVTHGDPDRIAAQSSHTLVVALPKFTLPDQKHLKIELMEKNGGRHLTLKVKNKHLMRAKTLN